MLLSCRILTRIHPAPDTSTTKRDLMTNDWTPACHVMW